MEFNVADVADAVAATVPDRTCIVFRDRRLSYAQFASRSRRLANVLYARGLGARCERDGLAPYQSHQDHLAIYLHNGNEYLEATLGAHHARVAPFNVNYRYVSRELQYLLENAQARAVVYHAAFAPRLAEVLPHLPRLELLIQVADDSGNDLLPGALDYEEALSRASSERPDVVPSPDDLSILYTGGTTGMPKGVLWRQADMYVAAFTGHRPDFTEHDSIESVVEQVRAAEPGRIMATAPFMHGAGNWLAMTAVLSGLTLVVQGNVARLDPDDVLATVEREGVEGMVVVGDAFARPMLEAIERGAYDLSSLVRIWTGGAALNVALKERFQALLPGVNIHDGVGASEAGVQLRHITMPGETPTTGRFELLPGSCVLSAALDRELHPGEDELGWLARRGRVPLGYLDDPEKTARTFPTIGGVRYSVPGDRARLLADGTLELHGRDSVTINSGGEKIFAEEIESVLAVHPAVYDVLVVGRPSERWGQEVVAVVATAPDVAADAATEAALAEHAATQLARFKLPKAYVFVDRIVRAPSGKADYRWAQGVAAGEPAKSPA